MDTFAPYKTYTITKENSTPWLTDEIRNVMNIRDMYKYNFNKTGNSEYDKKFKILKNKVTGMMRQSQKTLFNGFDLKILCKERYKCEFLGVF